MFLFSGLLFVLALVNACMKDDYEGEIIDDSPAVIANYPTDGDNDVSVDSNIRAKFNMAMVEESFNDSSIVVVGEHGTIQGSIAYADSVVTFTPSDYLPDYELITVTVAKETLASSGFMLEEDFIWTFTSGSIDHITPPEVVTTYPENDASDVLINVYVKACFSKELDPASINEDVFRLRRSGLDIRGTVTYDAAQNAAYFSPEELLEEFTEYTAHILPGIRDLRQNVSTEEFSWTFTTGSKDDIVPPVVTETAPLDGETNVVRNSTIHAVFSKSIDPATIHDGSMVLICGGEELPGTVTPDNNELHFMPMNYLESNTEYTVRISADVADFIGNAMGEDHEWAFTTSDVIETIAASVNLGLAENFAIFAAKGIANIAGIPTIIGDVGLYPANVNNITGFPDGSIQGDIYAIAATPQPGLPEELMAIKSDILTAYQFASTAWQPLPVSLSGNQAGVSLKPGVYDLAGDLVIQDGDLVLDAKGNPHTYWIFRIGGGINTTGAGGNVILEGGAQPGNIFWQVSESAQIGANTQFPGTILANSNIVLGSQAIITGRLLVLNGKVTLINNNTVMVP